MARSIAGAAPGRTNRRFLVIAVLFAVMSAVLAYTALSRTGGDDGKSGAAAGDTQVVVAKRPIQQNIKVTADMLALKSVPSDTVVAGAFTSVTDAVDKVTRFPLDENQQVGLSAVVGGDAATATGSLAEVVPTGRRAISISSSQTISAGGLILPGDWVDIVWICCDNKAAIAKTVVQNVQVAAVAQEIVSGRASGPENPAPAVNGENQPDATSISLLVTPEEAHRLRLAEVGGQLSVTLRGKGDGNIAPDGAETTLITDVLPPDIVARLPKAFWPDGYKQQ